MRPLILIFALLATPASAFIANNSLRVEPRGAEAFHVKYRGGKAGANSFWCAAGDYVTRELGMPNNTLIYRTSSVPRRAGKGISFSLSSEGANKPGLIIFPQKLGITAGFARALCPDRMPRRH